MINILRTISETIDSVKAFRDHQDILERRLTSSLHAHLPGRLYRLPLECRYNDAGEYRHSGSNTSMKTTPAKHVVPLLTKLGYQQSLNPVLNNHYHKSVEAGVTHYIMLRQTSIGNIDILGYNSQARFTPEAKNAWIMNHWMEHNSK